MRQAIMHGGNMSKTPYYRRSWAEYIFYVKKLYFILTEEWERESSLYPSPLDLYSFSYLTFFSIISYMILTRTCVWHRTEGTRLCSVQSRPLLYLILPLYAACQHAQLKAWNQSIINTPEFYSKQHKATRGYRKKINTTGFHRRNIP
jgi:Ni,Fe-hydrogenase I cytochrome b subunit